MICRIQGLLESLLDGRATIALPHGLTYELLLPSYVAARLGGQIGSVVTLHTIHYLESSNQGASLHPRLVGFTSTEARAFYELFTTVKGIGPRKALRALAIDHRQIASAIAARDVKLLQTLPEIGKRMAETVVVTLHDKVDAFVDGSSDGADGRPAAAPMRDAAREALEVLVQLGESRPQAARWIEAVLIRQPDLDDAQQIITRALATKSGD